MQKRRAIFKIWEGCARVLYLQKTTRPPKKVIDKNSNIQIPEIDCLECEFL
jgi:hypothetical protein